MHLRTLPRRHGGRPAIGAATSARRRRATAAAAIAGAMALAASAAIHLHLWAGGYRHIPTVGPLFLLQGITAVLLAAVVLVWRSPLPALAGAGFLVATAGGLLLSSWVGIFGFHDHLDAPDAGLSLGVEAAGAVVLLSASALAGHRQRRRHRH